MTNVQIALEELRHDNDVRVERSALSFGKGISMSPEDVKQLQNLSEQQRWSDLLGAVNQHLQSDPEPDADWSIRVLFLFRGAANMNLDRHGEAVMDCSRVIQAGADSGTAWYSRACCFLVLASRANGPEKVLLLRRCLVDLDEALFREPGHSLSSALRRQVAPLLGEPPVPSSKADYWEMAKKVAELAGTFVGSAIK
jgi:hypothetical protein